MDLGKALLVKRLRSHMAKSTKLARPRSLELVLPATSANLGPAFDAAALALDLSLRVRARVAKTFSIVARGRNADICKTLENNLILTTYRQVLASEGKLVPCLAIAIDNQIPIGKGCGSSAAARLAGIALAVHFGKLGWNDGRIVGEASRLEHHPDNAAACWMGGLVVARMASEGEAQVASMTPKGKWPLLLALPENALSTEKARAVLPEKYDRADVVTNIQNAMLLLVAFLQRRPDLLSSALEDRIHHPYRALLCPLLPALQGLPRNFGVMGAVLSGAGPSVLMFVDPKADPRRVRAKVGAYLRDQKVSAELIVTRIRDLGARRSSGRKAR
jgi:homoserine kinase